MQPRPDNLIRAGGRATAIAFAAPFLALVAALPAIFGPDRAQAAPRCLGERATIVRGGGNNVIQGTKGHDVIHAGGGRDRVFGKGGNDRICGGPGRDVLVGGRGSDRVAGNGGDDWLRGARGKDRLFGGRGEDRLVGLRGSDRLNGGPGDDRLEGGSGNDRLRGGPGADLVDGGRGDDPLVAGGAGDFDNVVGGTGGDRISGGPGAHDIASFVTTAAPLQIDLGAGRVRGGEQEKLRGFEDALGGSGPDTLIGDAASNRLDGGPGDDTLRAVGGSDAAFGGPGSDACLGAFASGDSCGETPLLGRAVIVERVRSIDSADSLVITGTAASDRIVLRRSGGRYLARSAGVRTAPGVAQACAYAGSQLIACPGKVARIQLALGPGDDVLRASDVPRRAQMVIDGGAGSDEITGGAADDTLYGGDDRAPDRLAGGPGDDTLFGVNTEHPRKRSGRALLIGGPGDDLLVGGQPCEGDRFVGGGGRNDSASFARIRNSGVNVRAAIGGAVSDPDVNGCRRGKILRSVEKIEGSPGRDILLGDGSDNVLLGRGGSDRLRGRGGHDRCIGGGSKDAISCERRFP